MDLIPKQMVIAPVTNEINVPLKSKDEQIGLKGRSY